jgi:4-hydroxyphenylpyruvate dioxygenase
MPCSLAISTMSLGRSAAGHSLAKRLDMAQRHGYEGIEVFYEDLVYLARQLELTSPSTLTSLLSSSPHSHTPSADFDPLPESKLQAARQIRQLCTVRHLEIVCLQPFMHYEGLLDRAAHARRLEEFKLWLELAHEMETDLIAIPSSFLPAEQVSDDMELIVSDLREAADLAAAANPPLRLSYEALAWGTRVSTVEESWDVVRRVDRSNFGICLDSFNIAARLFADPAAESGTVGTPKEALAGVMGSMARLVAEIDPAKIFYVQIVDGERLEAPLVKGHPFYQPDQPPRMSWSRNCRLFYREGDKGAYLPVREIAWAIFQEMGFDGWVSMELFNRRMSDKGEEVPEELAMRGAESWKRLVDDMKLHEGVSTVS